MSEGYSKSRQVGPRREKVKSRLGQPSRKKMSQSQSVFDRFCDAARAEGFEAPLSMVPNRSIDQRLTEHGLENVCEAIEFGVRNWSRIKEFFPRAVFAPEPTLRELCLPWVMEGLIPRMRHQVPVSSHQSGSQKVQPANDARVDERKRKDEIVKQRILKQLEENKKKYSAG